MLEMLLGNSVAAAGLALLVLIFCRSFRPGPATRHALWFLVVVKLLSPVGLFWKESLPFERPRFLTDAEKVRAAPAPTVTTRPIEEQRFVWVAVDPNDADASANLQQTNSSLGNIAAAETSTPNILTATSPTLKQSLYLWFLIIWIAGALVVGGRYFLRTLRFARYARSGKEASPSLQRQVAHLAARLGVRAPLVRVLPDLPSPVVWSLFRPVLLWPKGLQNQLSGDGRQTVIVHELAHLLRKDHWFRWLELLAAVVHWWNPVFWIARRQMRFHAELACDAWVTGTLPENRRAYAEALLEVCARTIRAAVPSPAVGLGGDGRRDFQRRLTMIMRDRVPCRLAAGAKMFVVLLAVAALPAWTLGQAKPTAPAEAVVQQSDVEFTGLLDFDLDGFPDILIANANGQFVWTEEGTADAEQIEKIKAQIEVLNQKLKALRDAKKTSETDQSNTRFLIEKLKQTEPLKFKTQTITVGADGKVIGGTTDVKTEATFLLETAKPEHKEYRVIIVGSDGKVIEAGGGNNANEADAIRWLQNATDGKSANAPLMPHWVRGRQIKGIAFSPDGKTIAIEGDAKPAPAQHKEIHVEVVNPADGKQPQIKVIGADGKEIKDIKILIDRLQVPATAAAPAAKPLPPVAATPIRLTPTVVAPTTAVPLVLELKLDEAKKHMELAQARFTALKAVNTATMSGVVTLTRSTSTLPKGKAEALAAFLKANIKASVLETKVEGDSLTVTTTPEVQTTIGGIVKLIQDKGGDKTFQFFYEVAPQAK